MQQQGERSAAGGAEPRRATLSVVVPVYRGGTAFVRCLAALERSVRRADEVIVVVDGGDERSAVATLGFEVRVLVLPTRLGPAAARNRGAQAAQGDLLVFVDSDVAVRPTTLGQIEAIFADDPELAALIGSYDQHPAEKNFYSQYKNLLQHYVHQRGRPQARTFWGACGAIRRQVLLELGGFDETYRRPCVEDIEFGYRMHQAGQVIRLCPQVQVTHLKRWTLLALVRSDLFHRAIPWTRLILSRSRLDNDLNLRWSNRLAVALAWLIPVLAVAWWYSGRWWAGLLTCAGLLAMAGCDWQLHVFFRRQRGWWFAARAAAYQWLYHFYSGVGFAAGLAGYRWDRLVGTRTWNNGGHEHAIQIGGGDRRGPRWADGST